MERTGWQGPPGRDFRVLSRRVTGGELFEDIVAREYYSEADARWVRTPHAVLPCPLPQPHSCLTGLRCPGTSRADSRPDKVVVCPPRVRAQACLLPSGGRWPTEGAVLGVAGGRRGESGHGRPPAPPSDVGQCGSQQAPPGHLPHGDMSFQTLVPKTDQDSFPRHPPGPPLQHERARVSVWLLSLESPPRVSRAGAGSQAPVQGMEGWGLSGWGLPEGAGQPFLLGSALTRG